MAGQARQSPSSCSPRGRERDAGRPVRTARSRVLLEAAYLPRRARARHAQHVRRLRDGAVLGDGDEVFRRLRSIAAIMSFRHKNPEKLCIGRWRLRSMTLAQGSRPLHRHRLLWSGRGRYGSYGQCGCGRRFETRPRPRARLTCGRYWLKKLRRSRRELDRVSIRPRCRHAVDPDRSDDGERYVGWPIWGLITSAPRAQHFAQPRCRTPDWGIGGLNWQVSCRNGVLGIEAALRARPTTRRPSEGCAASGIVLLRQRRP